MPNEIEPGSQPTGDTGPTADERMGQMVNAAVTSHLRRFTEKQLPEILGLALKPITDKLNAPPVAPVEEPTGGRKSKDSPELLAMAKKLEDMEKALSEGAAKVVAAEKKARDERSFTELRAALEGKVRPELLDMVAKHLFVVEGRIETDDAGSPLFKSTKIPYAGADPEDQRLPLKAGVEDFLKSDAAKPFLPAPSAGSGTSPLPKRGPTPSPSGTDFSKPATSDADKVRRAIERERIAKERLANM